MAGIKKSALNTVDTATEAVNTAADAVRTAREAIRTAKKAGSQAKVVAKKVADRVTGREAERRKKVYAIAASAATATVVTGAIISRVRRGRKH
jgi:hypothetical protein